MYENIMEKINDGNWAEATRELSRTLSGTPFDEQLAILAATVFVATGDVEWACKAITEGLKINHQNYELWLILGQAYEISNVNQAYLCYENALFYCDNSEDAGVIRGFMDNLEEDDAFCVNPCAIILLSYNALRYTKECIESIRATCPESAYEIIVIDNASSDGSVQWLEEQGDIVLQCNAENVGFPAGCNQGIRLAQGNSDIFLLNNDTILPPNALFWLRMGLYENENVGATGSVSNHVSNFQQVRWNCQTREEFLKAAVHNNLPMERPYERRLYLVGFAMLIRRKALEETGYLDEIFTPGTYEDNDMGFRLCERGYEVALCRNSFIFHYGSGGGANTQKWNGLYARNAAKLADKWDFDTNRYLVVWQDAIERMRVDEGAHPRILEVGCGLGCTLMAMKDRFPGIEVYGIENNRSLWPLIPEYLNVCHCGPETGTLPYQKGYFDLIFMGEVFDNSVNQTALVEKYAEYLNPGGLLVTRSHVLSRRDIFLWKENAGKVPSIAMCMFTHNHPGTVAQVLASTCLNYYLHGIDVYYYDSSEDDETKRIVEAWINKGYSNLYYVEARGFMLRDKFCASSKGEGLVKQYDYIWPSKDRSIWPKETMDAVREHIMENPDIMYLEVRGNALDPEKNIYRDGIELYQKHSLGLTSIDTSIYKYNSIYSDTEEFERAADVAPGFAHYYWTLNRLAEMKEPKLCVLQGRRIALYNVDTNKPEWERTFFRSWKEYWIRVNDQLPDCYTPYKEQVLKQVVSAPWLIGGIQRLQELKEAGALTKESLDELQVDWERVSDIPFEEVKKIAEG